jgi:hypothetical protein
MGKARVLDEDPLVEEAPLSIQANGTLKNSG